MDYEKAWEELESVIKSNAFIYNPAFMGEEKSIIDRIIGNVLDAVDTTMEILKEKYNEEEA